MEDKKKDELNDFEQKLYDRLFVMASEVAKIRLEEKSWINILDKIIKKYIRFIQKDFKEK